MDNRTALITGSYGGLGTCFVNIHASQGGDLILVGRSQEKLDQQAEETKRKYNVNVKTIAVDPQIVIPGVNEYDGKAVEVSIKTKHEGKQTVYYKPADAEDEDSETWAGRRRNQSMWALWSKWLGLPAVIRS